MKVILQTTQSDCLIACAAMILSDFECNVPVYKLAEKIELSRAGSNVLQLREALNDYGFGADGYKVEKLKSSMLPAIAYVNNNHFIVISKVKKNRIDAIDPSIGRISYENKEFYGMYSGVILKIYKTKEIDLPKEIDYTLNKFKGAEVIRIMVGLMITSVASQLVAMSYSYMYSGLIEGESSLGIFLILLAAITFLCIGSIVQGILTNKFNIVFEKLYGNNILDQTVAKNYKFFSFRSNGDILYRLNARGVIKDSFLLKMIPSLIAFCTVVLVQWILFKKNIFVGIVFMILVFLYMCFYLLIGMRIYSVSNKYTQKIVKLNTTTENIVRSILTIKVLGVEDNFKNRWHKENEEQTKEYGSIVKLQSAQNVISNIFLYIVPIGTVIIGSFLSNNKGNYIYEMALLPLLYLVIQNVTIIGQAFNSIYTVLPVIDKTNELLDESYMRERKKIYTSGNDAQITITNMSYYYGNNLCLKNVNLAIKKGKKYAVIGKSGSGKSTFLKIISNLLCDYQGDVFFSDDGHDKSIYMDQDATIIDSTIFENVMFGQENIQGKGFHEVVKAVGLDKIVDELPMKWNTEISKGKSLSRGQEQRICLARCLLQDSDIYLLDEATSNIDVIDEELIIQNLLGPGGMLNEKTVFVSTHKLSLIKYVDEVIYINHGIIYKGKHEDLLNKHMDYREMFEVK